MKQFDWGRAIFVSVICTFVFFGIRSGYEAITGMRMDFVNVCPCYSIGIGFIGAISRPAKSLQRKEMLCLLGLSVVGMAIVFAGAIPNIGRSNLTIEIVTSLLGCGIAFSYVPRSVINSKQEPPTANR